MPRRVLFISNGPREDNDAVFVIKALAELAPDVACEAFPIVGLGRQYERNGIPVRAPVRDLPSDGFPRKRPSSYLRDLYAGWLGLTLAQVRVLRRIASEYDHVHATGDWFGQSLARLSRRPFTAFISPLSAYDVGSYRIGPLLRRALTSDRCRSVITRDPHTAADLARQGFARVETGGLPALDFLAGQGREIGLVAGTPVLALLPGSHMPEAERNLTLLLRVLTVRAATSAAPLQVCVAAVPRLMDALPRVAEAAGWRLEGATLHAPVPAGARPLRVDCHSDAFGAILGAADAVLGMTGLAVEQAAALGKAVIQIAGEGPQFTARFAEAQERLIGPSARTVCGRPGSDEQLAAAARLIDATLADEVYRDVCRRHGPRRFSGPGGAYRIARAILNAMDHPAYAAALRPGEVPALPAPERPPPRVLFISNGHGEDNDSVHVIRALRARVPDIQCAALPIVGVGREYLGLGVPILGPTADIPSGGFTYVNRLLLLDDLRAGLLGLTLGQLRALGRVARNYDLIVGTGDFVAQSFARASGRRYLCFITSLSAMYEGRLRVGPVLGGAFRASRRTHILTRDRPTAEDLSRQGFRDVAFGGLPSLDWLTPSGRDLGLDATEQMGALLPGSRMPEAARNLGVMLRFATALANTPGPAIALRAAIVPALRAALPEVAADAGWALDGDRLIGPGSAKVVCPPDAFADILHRADIVVGMAGLAVDQAVALGKPVLQIAGEGPQFNARFAEAQECLLGLSVRTIGPPPVTDAQLAAGADLLRRTLADADYLAACRENGRTRLGTPGGADRVAQHVLKALGPSDA